MNSDLHSILPALMILTACVGIIMVSLSMYAYLFLSSGNRLYLAVILISITGLMFAGNEIGVMISFWIKNSQLGRQFHRFQALSAAAFLFSLPYLLYKLLDLNRGWQRANLFLTRIGLVIFLAMAVVAFAFPDLFVSQTMPRTNTLQYEEVFARGKSGPVYLLRDGLFALLMMYAVICLISDLRMNRRKKYLLLPLSGIIISFCTGAYDLMYVYWGLKGDIFHRAGSSTFSAGITVFIIFSMIGTLKIYIDRTRDFQRAMKIQSLGIFAGGIAHDFNNLLTTITGNLSLLSAELGDNNPHQQSLEDALRATDSARKLTYQLLTFSQGGILARNITSLENLLRTTAEFVLRGSSIKLELDIAPNLYHVTVDQDQMNQVIHNIIINAVQSMPETGTITVKAENLDGDRELMKWKNLDFSRSSRFCKITISDTGPGIASKDISRVFDPYFTTRESGSGLGLAICYSIIKKHEGNISVNSKKGEGTSFEIILPATERPVETEYEAEPGECNMNGSVLLMDDDELILNTGKRILSHIGFTVTTSTNGEEAVEKYREHHKSGNPFDLVILDITVPGMMGGREAIRLLKEIDPGVRAIVSSGYSNDPVMTCYQEHGFAGIINKPYVLEDVKRVVKEVCGV